MKQPFCPYCYTGYIVEDKHVRSVFFCRVCFKEVVMEKYY